MIEARGGSARHKIPIELRYWESCRRRCKDRLGAAGTGREPHRPGGRSSAARRANREPAACTRQRRTSTVAERCGERRRARVQMADYRRSARAGVATGVTRRRRQLPRGAGGDVDTATSQRSVSRDRRRGPMAMRTPSGGVDGERDDHARAAGTVHACIGGCDRNIDRGRGEPAPAGTRAIVRASSARGGARRLRSTDTCKPARPEGAPPACTAEQVHGALARQDGATLRRLRKVVRGPIELRWHGPGCEHGGPPRPRAGPWTIQPNQASGGADSRGREQRRIVGPRPARGARPISASAITSAGRGEGAA